MRGKERRTSNDERRRALFVTLSAFFFSRPNGRLVLFFRFISSRSLVEHTCLSFSSRGKERRTEERVRTRGISLKSISFFSTVAFGRCRRRCRRRKQESIAPAFSLSLFHFQFPLTACLSRSRSRTTTRDRLRRASPRKTPPWGLRGDEGHWSSPPPSSHAPLLASPPSLLLASRQRPRH